MAAPVPFHFLRSLANNQVMDIANGDVSAGTAVILWDKNFPPSPNQLWRLENIGDGRCHIVSAANPNMVLDVEYGFAQNGSRLIIYDRKFPPADNQLFTWNDGIIRSCLPGNFAIDAKQAGPGEASDSTILWTVHGNVNQRWAIDYP